MSMGNFRGFTVVEIIVVMVICGIMLVVGLTNHTNFVEKSRGKNAETNLSVIYNAEKRYKLDSGDNAYLACTDVSHINSDLNVLIDDPYFTYSVTADADSFRAVATRNQFRPGPCTGKTVFITDVNSSPQKDCIVWR